MWFFGRRKRGIGKAETNPYFSSSKRPEGLTLKCVWCGKRIEMFAGNKVQGTIYGLCLECRAKVLAARSRFNLQQA